MPNTWMTADSSRTTARLVAISRAIRFMVLGLGLRVTWDGRFLAAARRNSSAQDEIQDRRRVVQRQPHGLAGRERDIRRRGHGRDARIALSERRTGAAKYFDTPQPFELPKTFDEHEVHGSELAEQYLQTRRHR